MDKNLVVPTNFPGERLSLEAYRVTDPPSTKEEILQF